MFEWFEPWGGEHAHQVLVGFFVHGQPAADAFRLLHCLTAHATRVERLCDRKVGFVTHLHHTAVTTHPHTRVDTHATLDLREPLHALRFTHDRRAVSWLLHGRTVDAVFRFDAFDRMPTVQGAAFAGVVFHVGVTPVEAVFARAPTQVPFAQIPDGFLVSGVDDRCLRPVFRGSGSDELQGFAGDGADDVAVVWWREGELQLVEDEVVGGGQSFDCDWLIGFVVHDAHLSWVSPRLTSITPIYIY